MPRLDQAVRKPQKLGKPINVIGEAMKALGRVSEEGRANREYRRSSEFGARRNASYRQTQAKHRQLLKSGYYAERHSPSKYWNE